MLFFLYKGELPVEVQKDAKELKELMLLADSFAIPAMTKATSAALSKILNLELAIDALSWLPRVCTTQSSECMETAKQIILDEYKGSLQSQKLAFEKLSLEALLLILQSDRLQVDSENQVWRKARFWVAQNKPGTLADCVRHSHMFLLQPRRSPCKSCRPFACTTSRAISLPISLSTTTCLWQKTRSAVGPFTIQ